MSLLAFRVHAIRDIRYFGQDYSGIDQALLRQRLPDFMNYMDAL